MPDIEQQDRTFSERVVREAVDKGMESPLRETIIEAVNEAEGSEESVPKVPYGAGMLAIGGAVGYLLGIRSVQQSEREEYSMAPSEEPEIVDESETEETAETTESGGSWLKRIALLAGIVGAVALIRRQLSSSDQEEWEPIEEFETSVPTNDEDETEDESIEIETDEDAQEETQQDETDIESDETEE